MGQLPPVRTQPLRPFQCIRVEFAGPFTTKRGYTRKPMFEKSYVALFICLPTKAIHVDVTEDLSTGSFLLCFERFISRRGCPSHIFSDNGRNFVGAARILGQPTSLPYNFAEFSDKISKFSPRNVQWHFIPARFPHFGGLVSRTWTSSYGSSWAHLFRPWWSSTISLSLWKESSTVDPSCQST